MKNRTTTMLILGLLVTGGSFFAIPQNVDAATYSSKTQWRQALRAKLQRNNNERKQKVLRGRMSGKISFEGYSGTTVSETKEKSIFNKRRNEARKRIFSQLLGTKRAARKALVAKQRANGTFHYEYEVAVR